MAINPRPSARFLHLLESRFEGALWRLRLIAILPVVMTAISSFATFILGTKETLYALNLMVHGGSDKQYVAKVLGGFVGGVDLYLVGIALLIFSYGTYELLISAIDPAREGEHARFTGVLDVDNLDDLKEKLVKVLVVALLVFAFKSMIALPINDGLSLLYYSLALLLLSLCAFLMGKLGHEKG
jgi:uncharacterized membrane protein YqhA